ncbi:MAG: tRNA epoxyqueuosine(34) reductase QueG [Clostridium sp.]|nr:tRNA epoxyqueuosine(34) reductase QueG [Clostridium sp.]
MKQKIIDFCSKLGISEVGFSKCETFSELEPLLKERKVRNLENEFEEKDIQKRINPNLNLKYGKTIISIAFPYLFYSEVQDSIYFSVYTRGKDYHKVVLSYLEEICHFIKGFGKNATAFVDSNALPERYIAFKSGIGFIGKNNMLINKKYGSYVFLGEIITDLDIEPDTIIYNKCEKCDKCLKACPTRAISNGMCKPNICLSYITQKKDVEDSLFEKFDGRLFGCDACQKVCPYNIDIEYSSLEAFKPFDFMSKIDINEILNMDKKLFREKYAITSSGWRGKNILQRNLLIAIFSKMKQTRDSDFNFKSPYVMEYYHRLLKYYKL